MKSDVEVLYQPANDLPKAVRLELSGLLNQQLADAMDLCANVKQAYWNVRGTVFLALHRLLEEIQGSVDDCANQLAARVVQLGGVAQGSVRLAGKRSRLNPYPSHIRSAPEHAAAIHASLTEFGKSMRKTASIAAEMGDQGTANTCKELARRMSKWLWYVEAHGHSNGEPSRSAQEEVAQ